MPVKKVKGGFKALSTTSHKDMGTYSRLADAQRRVAQGQMFKSLEKSGQLGKQKSKGIGVGPKHPAKKK